MWKMLKKFDLPVAVAVNHFIKDTDDESKGFDRIL